ncbi:MAG: hypothetical protein V1846_04275 [Candidatus Komeilibacteria bacterium]
MSKEWPLQENPSEITQNDLSPEEMQELRDLESRNSLLASISKEPKQPLTTEEKARLEVLREKRGPNGTLLGTLSKDSKK